jgi:excisionase family DNA binding protein
LKISKEQLLTPSEAAVLLSVSPTTIRLWAQNGGLSFIKTSGGHRRFARDELLTLMIALSSKVKTTFIDDNATSFIRQCTISQ